MIIVMIDRDLPTPPYQQLADILRSQIRNGEISGRLPSEKYLMEQYQLAMGTVRKALGLLRDEGLVVTVAGMGSYVKR